MVVAVRPPMAELSEQRTAWVRQYRHDHAVADVWARGLRHVWHSMETQERVFRMAEQLARSRVDRTDLFMALEEADRCVALSTDPHVASEAGYRVISTLVRLALESLTIRADEDESDLRALGFDPIAFDGHDPSAYAWVMYNRSTRAAAKRRPRWRGGVSQASATPRAIGLARL